jgi:GH35 family endo-1,4-beta-xylanase
MKLAEIDVNGEEVFQNLQYEVRHDKDGNSFVVCVYYLDPEQEEQGETLEGPIPLVIATQNEIGTWEWSIGDPGHLARLTGTNIGSQVVSYELPESAYRDMAVNFGNQLLIDGELHSEALFGIPMSQAIQMLRDGKQIQVNFDDSDKVVRFANQNGLRVFSHVGELPLDIRSDLMAGRIAWEDYERFVEFFIKTAVTRYDGTDPELVVHEWIVSNEVAAHLLWANQDRLITELIQQGTLAKMFVWAKEANPNARLVLNEDHLLERGEDGLRSTYLSVVDTLQKQGAPIDAAGIQNHLWLGRPLISYDQMQSFLERLEQRDLHIVYSELTISKSKVNQLTGEQVNKEFQDPYLTQAEYLRNVLAPLQGRDAAVYFFGFADYPHMFDKDNLNDPTAEAAPFTRYANPQARPMYYVLLNWLMQNAQD